MNFYVLAGAAVIAASAVPCLYGAATSPPGTGFVWGVGFLPDTVGNLMFTRQAADGALLFMNAYTGEPHPARLFNPLFLAAGWTQRATGLPPGLVFQLFRVIFAAALLHSIHAALLRLFSDEYERRLSFLLVAVSGGFGFLAAFAPAFHLSADIRGAEITTFFSMYQQAHFAAALALIVRIALAFERAMAAGSVRAAAGAGALHLLLVSIHPYDAPATFAAASLHAGLFAALFRSGWRERLRLLKPLGVFLAFPLPLIAWNGYLAGFVPMYREFAGEGLVADPWPLIHYLLGYGLLVPLAFVGLKDLWHRRDSSAWLFPAAWIVAVPAVMILPLPARRKLLEGYHLFLCLLAARGAFTFRHELGTRFRALAAGGLVVLGLSSFYVMARDAYAISVSRRPQRPQIRMEAGRFVYPFNGFVDRIFAGSPWLYGIFLRNVDRYYVPADLARILSWSSGNLERGTVVLSAPETGLLVPILSPHRVLAGHLFETLNMRQKDLAITAFMDPELPDESRQALLDIHGVGAVLMDSYLERRGRWRPTGDETWLKPLRRFGRVSVLAASPRPPAPHRESHVRAEIDASLFKAEGSRLLDAGRFTEAALSLERALRLRATDHETRQLLKECEKHLR